jgi:hypothetical protein
MNDRQILRSLVRIAHKHPKTRKHLLPLIARQAADWIQDAIERPGALHKHFGIPEDEKIPTSTLTSEQAKLRAKEDKSEAETRLLRQINLALTLRSPAVSKSASNSGHDILMQLVDKSGWSKVYSRLLKEDRQSADLLRDSMEEIMEALELTRGQQEALNRLIGMTMNGTNWDVSLLRNNVFKIANSLGLKLPSGMF